MLWIYRTNRYKLSSKYLFSFENPIDLKSKIHGTFIIIRTINFEFKKKTTCFHISHNKVFSYSYQIKFDNSFSITFIILEVMFSV